jgi:Ca2+-binding RTX toxin-like protein
MFAQINTNIAAGDSYDSIENLIGSRGFDNLRGTTGDNLIQGMANVDYIFGRSGDDTLDGGVGDDVLLGGVGADVLIGGIHKDRAQYSESLAAVVLDLLTPANNTGEAAGDSYDGIEGLAGSSYDDRISGDNADNQLFGRDGADRLFGRDGDDYLNGGAHGDRLAGGAGDDTLRGGTHADTFVFNDGADVIEDFNFAHRDVIALDATALGLSGQTAAQIVADYGSIVGGQVVLDFGADSLTIESLSDLAGLENSLSLI